jgi:hypothetical protein
MNKKVVPFRMPSKATLPPDDAPSQGHPLPFGPRTAEQASSTSLRDKPETKPAIVSKADQWVQHLQTGITGTAAINLDTPEDASVAVKGLTIDLTAHRDLQEVVALALFIPPMLGWFWLFNMASRYWSAAR